MKVAIIASTSRHKYRTSTAEEMYSVSPLFRYSVAYCKDRFDKVYVLSVKQGLIPLNRIIEPNDFGLDLIQRKDLKDWLEQASNEIKEIFPNGSELHFFAGKRFRKLISYLNEYECHEPLKGMGIGKQLNYLISKLEKGGE